MLRVRCETCAGNGAIFDDPDCYACTCPTCDGEGFRTIPGIASLFIVCSHGRRSAHDEWWPLSGKWCPGGRPATLEDLGGEKVWWCETHSAQGPCAKVENLEGVEVDVPEVEQGECWPAIWAEADMSLGFCRMVERILLPLPQMVAGESL